jgi:DNA-binding NarL/FixJ family response regulator
MMREAVRAALQATGAGARVVGEASTARESLEEIEKLRPAIVVMDILMPGSNGVAAIRDIRRLGIDCKIIRQFGREHPGARDRRLGRGGFGVRPQDI